MFFKLLVKILEVLFFSSCLFLFSWSCIILATFSILFLSLPCSSFSNIIGFHNMLSGEWPHTTFRSCQWAPVLILTRSLTCWNFHLFLCHHLVLQSGLTRFHSLNLSSLTVFSTEKCSYFLEGYISVLNLITSLAAFWILEITPLIRCQTFGGCSSAI